jgi:hypothetical protein
MWCCWLFATNDDQCGCLPVTGANPHWRKCAHPHLPPWDFHAFVIVLANFSQTHFLLLFLSLILLSSGQCNIIEIIKMHHDITSFFYCLRCGLNFRGVVIFYIIFCNPSALRSFTFNSNFSP